MHTELRGYARDRADPKLMLPTELLEQFHFGFPVHKRAPDYQDRWLRVSAFP